MRNKIRLLIVLVAFLIQPLLSAMLPAWLVPDLDFCILVVFAMTLDTEELVVPTTAILALALAGDIYGNQYVGPTVISLIVVLVALLQIKGLGNIENLLYVVIVAVSSTVTYNFIYWFIYALLSAPYSFTYMLARLPLAAIINIIVISIALFVAGRDIISKRRDNYFR